MNPFNDKELLVAFLGLVDAYENILDKEVSNLFTGKQLKIIEKLCEDTFKEEKEAVELLEELIERWGKEVLSNAAIQNKED